MIYSVLLSFIFIFNVSAYSTLNDPVLAESVFKKIKTEEPQIDFGDKLYLLSEQVDERTPNEINYICLTTDFNGNPLFIVNFDSSENRISLIENRLGSIFSNKVIQDVHKYMNRNYVMKKESGHVLIQTNVQNSINNPFTYVLNLMYKKSVFKNFLNRKFMVKGILDSRGEIDRYAIFEQTYSQLKEVKRMYFMVNYFLGKPIGIKGINVSYKSK